MIRIYYILKLILRGLRMRPWGSLLTFFACWFALCQLTLVLYAVEIADKASMMPANSGSMVVYLKNGISGTRIADIEKKLREFPEIASLKFIPRQAGLEKMKEWLGPDKSIVEGVDPSILPDAFEVTLKREHGAKAGSIAERIGKIQGVDDTRYHKGLMGYLAGSYHTIAFAGGLIAGLVVICLSLVIFLSVRVGIVSRKQEIEVLNLLGGQFLFI
jgi:cell division transport system permease protein